MNIWEMTDCSAWGAILIQEWMSEFEVFLGGA